ncbi:MAG: hemerythrin domain-containing protein [Thaumarchaeota archaeon]|nr:hemerythrin domain-containing protein [Nitrososphaerota archaeon]
MGSPITELTSKLRQEHALIIQEVNQIMNLAQRTATTESYCLENLQPVVQSLKEYLNLHITREEKEFFPMLEEVMGKEDVVGLLKEEHNQIRSSIQSLVDRLDASLDLDLVKEINETLRQHISKEERVLFWLVEVKTRRSREAKRVDARFPRN